MTLKPIEIKSAGKDQDELTVELENYVLLSPDNIPLDDKSKVELQKVIAKNPLALIEYWSIDPDYDGVIFRSLRQDYRENQKDNYCVTTKAHLFIAKKAESESRTICVKTVDVFGFEAVTVIKVS